MGILLHLMNNPCTKLSICKNREILKVVKMDGKILKFTSPILVKDLLINYEAFGVRSSRKKDSKNLPQSFELKLGKVYYLLPCKDQSKKSEVGSEGKPNRAVTRIKVVITKQQFEDLLSKKKFEEKIIFGFGKSGSDSGSGLGCSSTNWKPSLTSIPEEIEVNITL